ncbi:MAG: NADH-quinone oxidoreductase subunit A [Elusimicrobia bacterium]|nr:NADH-quinone oxidoreductase subunit A [Elusimicrobiota bacterium]
MLIAFAINLLVVLALVLFFSNASILLGPTRRMDGDKGLPYETGMPPLEPRLDRMWVSYYRYAVLFVIFDVDLAFLVPWILLRHDLTLVAMISMTVFLLLVGLTLAYLWRKGALELDY